MTRAAVIKEFFRKTVLPVVIAGLLYCIFQSACIRNGELDLLWLWILCGLPFGLHRMFVWIVPGGGLLCGKKTQQEEKVYDTLRKNVEDLLDKNLPAEPEKQQKNELE